MLESAQEFEEFLRLYIAKLALIQGLAQVSGKVQERGTVGKGCVTKA